MAQTWEIFPWWGVNLWNWKEKLMNGDVIRAKGAIIFSSSLKWKHVNNQGFFFKQSFVTASLILKRKTTIFHSCWVSEIKACLPCLDILLNANFGKMSTKQYNVSAFDVISWEGVQLLDYILIFCDIGRRSYNCR